jgi:hypothetical protein
MRSGIEVTAQANETVGADDIDECSPTGVISSVGWSDSR